MENNEQFDETNDVNETATHGKAKQWLQDNLRIIISVVIVIAIAGGIYSYSKRTEAPVIKDQSEQVAQEGVIDQNAAANAKGADSKVKAGTSQETEKSFVENAGSKEGMTHLARRALANYLEKNPDAALTAEHKIYIEDYLRKNVVSKKVFVGTSVEFSKDQIQNAISKSKTLNERQLTNLHKYAVRVPSLS